MLSIEKIQASTSYRVIFTGNNKYIGDFIQAEDGCYYFAPNNSGLWSDYVLKAISDKLLELNRPWKEYIESEFNKGNI